MRGRLSEKVDIFSFGVVALEVVSNRNHEDRSLPDEMVYLLDWVPNSCEISNISDLLVPILSKVVFEII